MAPLEAFQVYVGMLLAVPEGEISETLLGGATVNAIPSLQGPSPMAFRARIQNVFVPVTGCDGVAEQVVAEQTCDAAYQSCTIGVLALFCTQR